MKREHSRSVGTAQESWQDWSSVAVIWMDFPVMVAILIPVPPYSTYGSFYQPDETRFSPLGPLPYKCHSWDSPALLERTGVTIFWPTI